jgi:hypothetical protein
MEPIEELTLLLIYLSSWEEKFGDMSIRTGWKGYRFELLDALEEKDYLGQSRKMVTLTPEGIAKARELQAKYLGDREQHP